MSSLTFFLYKKCKPRPPYYKDMKMKTRRPINFQEIYVFVVIVLFGFDLVYGYGGFL